MRDRERAQAAIMIVDAILRRVFRRVRLAELAQQFRSPIQYVKRRRA